MSRRLKNAAHRTAAPTGAPRPSRWARWRVDLRLARRQVWRTRGSSALVVLLVAMPVFALAGSAVFADSHSPSPVDRARAQLGRTQAWIAVTGTPDPGMRQAVDEPNYRQSTSDEAQLTGTTPTDPSAVLPAGTHAIELREYASAEVKTAGGHAPVAATLGPAWDPALTGRYTITSGAAPTSDGEAMVSPGLLDRIGGHIGDDVVLSDSGRSFRITGTMRRVDSSPELEEIFLPMSAADLVQPGTSLWFTPDWQPSYAQLQDLNHQGFMVYARNLAIDPPDGALLAYEDAGRVWQMLLVGALAAVFCGYLVVLLAGAAFAVSARRQERTLAVAASVGAVRGDTFRVVVMQGTVLGLIAGVVGAAAGIAASIGLMLAVDDGVRGSFWGYWAIRVPWAMVVGIVVFAVIVGTLAAIAPARTASRGDVIGALRGARRPARLNPRRPLWGLGMMVSGLAATAVGGLSLAAMNAADDPDYQNPLRPVLLIAMVTGPVIFQLGFIVGGHWILAMISRVLTRLGLAPRVAGRDAAANPSRVVPAFAAIAACMFLASFALTTSNMTTTASNRTYGWDGHTGSVMVWLWGSDVAEHDDAYVDAARAVLAPSHPAATALAAVAPDIAYDPDTGEVRDPDAAVWTVMAPTEDADPWHWDGGWQISVVDPDDLATIFGEQVPDADLDGYRSGAALSVGRWQDFVADDATVHLAQWTASGLNGYRNSIDEYDADDPTDSTALPHPSSVHTLPVRQLTLMHPQSQLHLLISPATARQLGIPTAAALMFASYPEPPDDDVVDAMRASSETVQLPGDGSLDVSVERGPNPVNPLMWVFSAAAGVLVLGAGAVCLGLARFERRPDDATLAAVGAARRLRRAVNLWQALIVVGVGTVIGTLAGLIPAWGIAQTSSDYLLFTDTPWLWLGAIALGLPAIMAAASWLVPPRAPDLTRRTAIA